MQLTLTVLRCPDQVVPETRTVGGGEYSVGRGPGVDWILPDPERLLSKQHFAVAFRGGAWQIADTSTNGTVMNRDAAPIGRGDVRTLRDGDRLKLGAYEIEVRLAEEATPAIGAGGGMGAGLGRGGAPSPAASPFGDPFGQDPFAPPPPAHTPFNEPPAHSLGLMASGAQLPHDFDPLAPDPGDAMFQGPTRSDHSSSLDDAFRPPATVGHMPLSTTSALPGDDLLPDDWDKDLLADFNPPAAPAAPPFAPAAAPPAPFAAPPLAPAAPAAAPFAPAAAPAAAPPYAPAAAPPAPAAAPSFAPAPAPAFAPEAALPFAPPAAPPFAAPPAAGMPPAAPPAAPPFPQPEPHAFAQPSAPPAAQPGFGQLQAPPDQPVVQPVVEPLTQAGGVPGGHPAAMPERNPFDEFEEPLSAPPAQSAAQAFGQGFAQPGAAPASPFPGQAGPGGHEASPFDEPFDLSPQPVPAAPPPAPAARQPAAAGYPGAAAPPAAAPYAAPPAAARPYAAPPAAAPPPYAPAPAAAAPAAYAPAPAVAAPGDAALLTAFMQGVGMPGAQPADPAATMRALGQAFRVLVSGLRSVLIARASIKSEFRIEQTMIRARGNNPLKFSAGDDDALAALLGTGRHTDMTPAAAVADALKDIRLHELASMAAMQSAVRVMLDGLDPAKLRAQADQGGGLSVLPAQRKARAWDAFEALHTRTVQALSDDFDSVFGKAFARAYEQALADVSAKERG
jgi:type VI secretion system FHA domain protein